MPEKAYEIRSAVDGYREAFTVFQPTAGKARYAALRQAQDAGYEISFLDIRARSLGVIETPQETAEKTRDAFNAAYPPSTPARVYPGLAGDESCAFDTVVTAPGAYLQGGPLGTDVRIWVDGRSYAITHVIPVTAVRSAR